MLHLYVSKAVNCATFAFRFRGRPPYSPSSINYTFIRMECQQKA
jgi:hypothetical protein